MESPDKENVPRGCLKLNNKVYPVYDGLNTVGRNPRAAINIKNLNISHQHAIITVVDQNSHFISDFKSSNGTILNHVQLNPLKLYKLNNGASIKFADVHCTYRKLEDDEQILDNSEASQAFSESFYSTNTQTVVLQNPGELINEMPTQACMWPPSIHELPTQVFHLDKEDKVSTETEETPKSLTIHELPTQVCNYEDSLLNNGLNPPKDDDSNDLDKKDKISTETEETPKTSAIHELPTQICNYEHSLLNNDLNSPKDDDSNDSIDFMTMQKVSESQAINLGSKGNEAGASSSYRHNTPTVAKSATSDAEEEATSAVSSLQSDIRPVKVNSSKCPLNTDSESPEDMQPNEEQPMSQICPVKIGSKQAVLSDSEEIEDSDTEEYIPLKERRRSRYVISDDSETDIEDTKDDKCNNTNLNDTDVIPSTQEDASRNKCETVNTTEPLEQSSVTSFRLELSEIVDDNQKVGEVSLKDVIAEDHIYCEKPDSQPTHNPQNGSAGDHIYCRSPEDATQKSEELAEKSEFQKAENRAQNENKKSQDMIIEGNTRQNDDDETQSVMDDEEPKPLTEELISNNDQREEEKQLHKEKISDENVTSLSTRESANDTSRDEKCSQESDKFQEVAKGFHKEDTESETRIVERSSQKIDEDETQSVVGDEESDPLAEELISNCNQKAEETKGFQRKDTESETKIVEGSTQKTDKDETQSIVDDGKSDPLTEESISNCNLKAEERRLSQEKLSAENVSSSENKQDENIYDKPTQQYELDFASDKKKENYKSDDDVFLQLTEKMIGGSEKDEIDDDIYIQPTQRNKEDAEHNKAKSSENSDEEIYFQSTQQLDSPVERNLKKIESPTKDHEFARPFQRFSAEKASTSKEIEDEIDLLPPTQALEILHKDEKQASNENISNHNSNSSEVEDQLEMMFYSQSDERFNATQQLVDVLEDNDIVEDSMLEENGRKSKPPEFSNNDSIRMVLDDFADEYEEDHADEQEVLIEKDEKKREKEESDKTSNTDNNKSKEDYSENKSRNDKTSTQVKALKEEIELDKNTPMRKSSRKKITDSQNKVIEETKQKSKEISDTGNSSGNKSGNNKTSNQVKALKGEIEPDNTPVRKSSRKKITDAQNEAIEEPKQKSQEISDADTSKKDKSVPMPQKKESQTSTDKTKESGIKTRRKLRHVVLDDLEEVNEEGGSSSVNSTGQSSVKAPFIEDENENITESAKSIGIRARRKKEKTPDNSEDNSNEKTSTRKRTKDTSDDLPKINVTKEVKTRPRRKKEDSHTSNEADEEDRNENVRGSEKNDVKEERTNTRSRKKTPDNSEEKSNTSETPSTAKMSTRTRTKDTNDDFVANTLKNQESEINISNNKGEKTRTKRKKTNSSDQSEKTDDDVSDKITQPSTSEASTRKRNLKTTNLDSDDEFEAKVCKVASSKKKMAAAPMVETPTTRKSARSRKPKLYDDEVISISSTPSSQEVISIPSTSTVCEEPPKKTRRLSANSRAVKNERGSSGRAKKSSNQNLPPPSTPERSKRQLKPKVVFTMMDSPELESVIRQLGGSVVDTVDACTVLVTGSVKRSQKLLCAVGQSKPICSPHWLEACKKAHMFLDPWDYILLDEEAEKKWQFSLKESLKRSSKSKFLENHTFQLIVNSAADVLKGAIEACGGKCVTRNLAKADTDIKMIVSENDCKNKCTKIVKANPDINVVDKEAIFDGTLRQEFRFKTYLLM